LATLERAGKSNPLLLAQHIARYNFASSFVKGGIVLDLGSGEAYGTVLLKKFCDNIAALDISSEAVGFAHIKGINCAVQADARAIPYRTNTFNTIVSFEVFEHITNVEKYLHEAHRVLKNGGVFLVSTPNVDYYPLAGMNPFHVKEYRYDEVISLLKSAGFELISFFAQETTGRNAAKLENSPILLAIMKWKRKLGYHGDLLPQSLQKIFRRTITGKSVEVYSPDDFSFVEGNYKSAEIIYVARAIKN
jgi:SAM-dependent methyltransferase